MDKLEYHTACITDAGTLVAPSKELLDYALAMYAKEWLPDAADPRGCAVALLAGRWQAAWQAYFVGNDKETVDLGMAAVESRTPGAVTEGIAYLVSTAYRHCVRCSVAVCPGEYCHHERVHPHHVDQSDQVSPADHNAVIP